MQRGDPLSAHQHPRRIQNPMPSSPDHAAAPPFPAECDALLAISEHLMARLDDIGFVDLELDAYLVEQFREAVTSVRRVAPHPEPEVDDRHGPKRPLAEVRAAPQLQALALARPARTSRRAR
jgi:hypothetical protein